MKKGRTQLGSAFCLVGRLSEMLFAAHFELSFHNICGERIERLPQIRDGQLHPLVNRAFQEARAVSRTETEFDQFVYGGFADVQRLALPLHLPLGRA